MRPTKLLAILLLASLVEAAATHALLTLGNREIHPIGSRVLARGVWAMYASLIVVSLVLTFLYYLAWRRFGDRVSYIALAFALQRIVMAGWDIGVLAKQLLG